MNIKLVGRVLGYVLLVEAAVMLLPILVALFYHEQEWHSFLIPALSAAALGGVLLFLTRHFRHGLYAREGFVIVGASWLTLSAFGALPFFISRVTPSFVDALFETISGFTTTGASILRNVEIVPHCLLFWRSFTHWVGGMGVLILFLALLPSLGERSIQLLRAESPGPSPSKIVPRIGDTAKILYSMYFCLTAAMIVALCVAGMPLFDSINHSLATAGTGGFSIKNASIGFYQSSAINIITSTFMIMFGVNFALYFYMLKRRYREVRHNSELRLYIGIITMAVLLIALDLTRSVLGAAPTMTSFGTALEHSYFQVSSIITTTGFSSTDFGLWPAFSQMVIVFLMLVGACSGSTGGGLKVTRLNILIKGIYRDIKKILHPRSVSTVRSDGRALDELIIGRVSLFFFAYMGIILLASLIVSWDGRDMVTSVTAVISCVSNIGPGLGGVGPSGNFADFSIVSKITLEICMLIGRLEIFPILVLFVPAAWKKS